VTSPTAEKAEGGRREALRLAPDRASARSGQAEGDERRAEGATGETYERRVDAGAAWGALVHGLLEHAMRHPAGTRADLERLARWLTVETPELRAAIPDALALVQAMTASDGWRRAREGREVHVEAPFAIRLAAPGATADPAAGPTEEPAVPILVRGVVDLVYRAADGWHIVDYKTDVDADEFTLLERYRPQLAQYRLAWERITGQPLIETRIVSAR
jgi:ATP-dependent exoDNAse (exonuclease V) beta subunit